MCIGNCDIQFAYERLHFQLVHALDIYRDELWRVILEDRFVKDPFAVGCDSEQRLGSESSGATCRTEPEGEFGVCPFQVICYIPMVVGANQTVSCPFDDEGCIDMVDMRNTLCVKIFQAYFRGDYANTVLLRRFKCLNQIGLCEDGRRYYVQCTKQEE